MRLTIKYLIRSDLNTSGHVQNAVKTVLLQLFEKKEHLNKKREHLISASINIIQ